MAGAALAGPVYGLAEDLGVTPAVLRDRLWLHHARGTCRPPDAPLGACGGVLRVSVSDTPEGVPKSGKRQVVVRGWLDKGQDVSQWWGERTMAVVPVERQPGRFPQTSRQERYGLTYLSDVCAEAGVGLSETRAGEDHFAIDAYVVLRNGPVPVQVKCTTRQFTQTEPRHMTWQIEQAWWDKWAENMLPVFVLLVQVPNDDRGWIDYDQDDATLHRTSAYWVHVQAAPGPAPASITLPRAQRFTAASLTEWTRIYRGGFGQ